MDPLQGPPPPDHLIGQTIGNYRVTQKLGEGGMGSVYLGEHPAIGKKVAIKVLHPEYSNNPDVARRFFDEASSVNKIGHPNIVDIIDYGTLETGIAGREVLVYFIMEYLSGNTLSGLLRVEAAPLPPERAFGIALQVADALAASHNCGIVHRDLKPDNIMLEQRGRENDFVKLLDFGIAKLSSASQGAQRTRTGLVMGTPAYMSPEQCEGRATVDNRTDIYALGIVVYEMLVGRVPFIGEGYGDILVQHLTQHPVPPSQFRILPAHVEVVVLKALEKRPEMRYPTMEEMMRALADPVGYVEANGGVGQFLQHQLMPSTAPVPVRLTPAPFTPAPGTLKAPSGIWGGTPTPSPTTLGAAAGEVQPGRSKTGFLIAGVLILAAAGAGVAIVLTGDKVDDSEAPIATNPGSDTVAVGSGSDDGIDPGSGTTGSGGTDDGSAASGSGSGASGSGASGSGDGSGSATPAIVMSKIVLKTRPRGATIYVDGERISAKTPDAFEILRSRQKVTITLKLDRYEDLVLKDFSVADDMTDAFVLVKKTRPITHGRGSNAGRGSNTGRGSGSSTVGNDTRLERPD